MRLVDADELKKNGYRLVHQDTKEQLSWPEVPTAYDVEAVCRKLLMESEGVCGYEMVLLDSADEIIRSGGI